jgi:hypothetical protein
MYIFMDFGGECVVTYDTYFQMPTITTNKPWNSIKLDPMHFTVILHFWIKLFEHVV